MAKMRIYTVHINPRKKHPYENPVFIEESFNWYAFIFRGFWALYQKLWLLALVAFAFEGAVGYLNYYQLLHPLALFALQIGFYAFLGFQANDIRRNKLKKQGYVVSDIVTGSDLVGAEQRYFERYYPHGRLPQTPPQSPPSSNPKPGLPLPA